MFRLGQQIRGHLVRLGRVVGDHQHLARSRQGIDAHLAVHRLLGQGHVDVARSADHIHFVDAFGAVGHGGDRLGTTDAQHAADTGQMGGSQNNGIHLTIPTRRRADHCVAHAGHPGGNGIHQHRAGVGRTASRHVKTSPLHRSPAAAEPFAVGSIHADVRRPLALMEFADAPVGQLQSVLQITGQFRPGALELLLRNLQRFGVEAIEPVGELTNGKITAIPDIPQDLIHPVTHLSLLTGGGASGQPSQFIRCRLRIPDAAQGEGHGAALRQGCDRDGPLKLGLGSGNQPMSIVLDCSHRSRRSGQ